MILKLNVHTTLNIWCDHRASDWMVQAWTGGIVGRMMGHTHAPLPLGKLWGDLRRWLQSAFIMIT
jgi:hypothetical protein